MLNSDEGNNDGLAVFSDTMDFCMNIIEDRGK